MTKWQLFSMLAVRGCELVTINSLTGIIQSIGREDGSGSAFLVTLLVGDASKGEHQAKMTVFVRTVD